MRRIGLQRGQRGHGDRRGTLPRRVLGHHPEQPPVGQQRGAGHPRPLRIAQRDPLGRQLPRSAADLHRQQPAVPAATAPAPDRSRRPCPGPRRHRARSTLHELRIADRMTPLHRIARRAVAIHRGQTDRRHGVDLARLDQRQVRPRSLRVADEPFVQRRVIHDLVRIANLNARPRPRPRARPSAPSAPPPDNPTHSVPRGRRRAPIGDHLHHPGSQRQRRQRLALRHLVSRGDLHWTASAIHRPAEHHRHQLLRPALPADACHPTPDRRSGP